MVGTEGPARPGSTNSHATKPGGGFDESAVALIDCSLRIRRELWALCGGISSRCVFASILAGRGRKNE
jgi:hypothetical protein